MEGSLRGLGLGSALQVPVPKWSENRETHSSGICSSKRAAAPMLREQEALGINKDAGGLLQRELSAYSAAAWSPNWSWMYVF